MVLEEFDEEGNAIVVGNYEFVEGILGKGSYGTVRLAKRRGDTTPGPSLSSSIHKTPSRPKRLSNSSSMSVPEGQEDNDESEIEKKPIAELNISMRGSLRKSSSAPYGKNPFDVDPNKATSNNVVGQLGLMVKNGFQKASSQLGSFFDDDADKRPEDNLYAVKIYEKSLLKKMRTMERDKETRKLKVHTALEQVEKEVALMKKMHHPNLVSLFEVIDSPESDILYMVIEYMPLGEILSYQDDGTFSRSDPNVVGYNAKTGHFDEATAALFMVDILHGLAYLHQHRVCHRDLKPENILYVKAVESLLSLFKPNACSHHFALSFIHNSIDSRGIVKIADFGVAHFFDDVDGKDFRDDDDYCKHGDCAEAQVLSQQDTEMALAMKKLSNAGMLNKTEGTWCFWSPEMCASQKFSGFAADMWAAGICLYIMVSGKLPFYSEIPTDLFEIIRDGELPCGGMGFSDSLLDLLHATLHKDANERAGVGDCLNHPFLRVAREKRVQQLSQAFERSRKRTVIVSEEDVRKVREVWCAPPGCRILCNYISGTARLLTLCIPLCTTGVPRCHSTQPCGNFQNHYNCIEGWLFGGQGQAVAIPHVVVVRTWLG